MLFIATVFVKMLSLVCVLPAVGAYMFSTKYYHVAIWGVVYIVANELFLNWAQDSRRTDLFSLAAGAIAFALVYGIVFWVGGYIKKRNSR